MKAAKSVFRSVPFATKAVLFATATNFVTNAVFAGAVLRVCGVKTVPIAEHAMSFALDADSAPIAEKSVRNVNHTVTDAQRSVIPADFVSIAAVKNPNVCTVCAWKTPTTQSISAWIAEAASA